MGSCNLPTESYRDAEARPAEDFAGAECCCTPVHATGYIRGLCGTMLEVVGAVFGQSRRRRAMKEK
jgi:hypothetical protein